MTTDQTAVGLNAEMSRGWGWRNWIAFYTSGGAISPNKRHLLATIAQSKSGNPQGKILLEDFQTNELITVFHEPGLRFAGSACAFAPDGQSFAVGTDCWWGIGGKRGDRCHGHVLLFKFNGP